MPTRNAMNWGRAAAGLGEMYRPPTLQEMAYAANARAKNVEAENLADFYRLIRDNPEMPEAQAQRLMGAADPAAYLRASAATRASAFDTANAPVVRGAVRAAIPAEQMAAMGMPAMIVPRLEGRYDPMTETEAIGERLRGDPELLTRVIMGKAQSGRGTIGEPKVYALPGKKTAVGRAYPDGSIRDASGNVLDMDGAVFYDPPDKTAAKKGALPKISEDYDFLRNTETGEIIRDEHGLPRVAVIPGSVAAGKADALAQGRAKDDALSRARAYTFSSDIDQIIDRVNDNPIMSTGVWGTALKGVPFIGQPAASVSAALEGIQANIGFDRLQQMRNASPTGGALGPVSDTENRLLQAAYGSVSQSQTASELRSRLRRVKAIYQAIVNDGADAAVLASVQDYSGEPDEPNAQPATGAVAQPTRPAAGQTRFTWNADTGDF